MVGGSLVSQNIEIRGCGQSEGCSVSLHLGFLGENEVSRRQAPVIQPCEGNVLTQVPEFLSQTVEGDLEVSA